MYILKSYARFFVWALLLSFVLLSGYFASTLNAQTNSLQLQVNASRTSGTAPLAVYFDTKGTSHSNSGVDEFHDVLYTWDFGDPNSGTWSTNGKSKNTDSGPVAAHVFENPGTYTITVTARDQFGTTATKQVQVTATSPNALTTYCYANDNTNWSGCPAGAQQIVTSSFATAVQNISNSDTRILLRRGDVFTQNGVITISNGGNNILGAFGAGLKPIVRQSANDHSINMSRMNDIRFVDIIFEGNGNPRSVVGFGTVYFQEQNSPQRKVLFYGVEGRGQQQVISIAISANRNEPQAQEIFIVDSNFTQQADGGRRGSLIRTDVEKSALLGTRVGGDRGEFNVRTQHLDGYVMAHNFFNDAANQKANLTIRGCNWFVACGGTGNRAVGTPGVGDTKDFIIAYNEFIYGHGGIHVGIGAQNRDSFEVIRNGIIENNFTRALPGSLMQKSIKVHASDVSIRNNVIDTTNFWADPNRTGVRRNAISVTNNGNLPGIPDPTNVRIYNNTGFDRGDWKADLNFIDFVGNNGKVANNILYAPNYVSASVNMYRYAQGVTLDANNLILQGSTPFVSASPTTPQDAQPHSSSQLIDSGTVVANFADYFNSARPQGAAWDIGAIEYGSGTVSTPPPAPSDTTAPTLSITAPTNGSTVSGIISFTAQASDASGITGVSFRIDGSTVATDTTSPYAVQVDTTQYTNGTHTLTTIATDTFNNTSSQSITITINNQTTQPTPSSSTKFVLGDEVEVTSGPLNVREAADGVVVGTQGVGSLGIVTNGPQTAGGYDWWYVDFATLPDGWVAEDFIDIYVAPPPPTDTGTTDPIDSGTGGSTGDDTTQDTGDTDTSSAKFKIGDEVEVATNVLNVRNQADGQRLGNQKSGARGLVMNGPQTGGGYTWWQIDFANLPDGWVAEDFVEVYVVPPPSTTFQQGDIVEVTAGNLHVRNTPNGESLGRQKKGTQGTIIAGPVYANNYWWWKIDYNIFPDGWSAEDFLRKIQQIVTGNTPDTSTDSDTTTNTSDETNTTTSGTTSSTEEQTTPTNTTESTPPTLSIVSPAPGGTLTGETFVLVNTEDESGIKKVDFIFNGEFIKTDTSSPYNATINAGQYSSGEYILSVVAYDTIGNVNTKSVSVLIKGESNTNSNEESSGETSSGENTSESDTEGSNSESFTTENNGETIKNISSALLAFWSFDDGYEYRAIDQQGNTDGTVVGGVKQSGVAGDGWFFNGENTGIYFGNSSSLNDIGSQSISLWIKPTSFEEGYLVAKRSSSGTGYFRLALQPGGKLAVFRDTSGNQHLLVSSVSGSVALNEWNHIVLTWDGTVNANGLRLYVNGQEVAYDGKFNGDGSVLSDAAHVFTLGYRDGGSLYYKGSLDEVRLYKGVLTPNEVNQLYLSY